MTAKSLIIICFSFAVVSCNNSQPLSPVEKKSDRDEMVDVNKFLIEKDNERIEGYIERKNLQMAQTSSGLWFSILQDGSGELFNDGSTVSFEYDCTLLDGTLCYSSEISGVKEVVIGKSNIESGLNEGLKLLNPGAEAIFILPPYLAFGLLGDGNLIPARAIIVYRVRVPDKD